MRALLIKTLRPLLHLLEKYRWWIFGVIYAFGVGVYYFVCKVEGLVSFYQAFALFAINVTPVEGANCNTWVYIAGIVAALYTTLSVVSLVAKRFIDTQSVTETSRTSYILVCGLGQKASAYIDSELLDNSNVQILAIEKDAQNPNIEKYRAKGVAVKVADAKDVGVLKSLHLEQTQHIVVLAGEDTDNLEIALALREVFKKDNLAVKKLYMHIDDRGLDKFYKDGGLLDDSAKLEVKMFSMSRNGAKALFLEHSVDGEGREYMDSEKPFSLVVVGHSKLAIEVIGQICELAHLPNENEVTIYCVDRDKERFQTAVEYRYTNIDKIPNITLEYVPLNYESRGFYADDVWTNDISNIMLCYDDAQTNLDIAAELADSTYLYAIDANTLTSKIHIAIYDNDKLADNINKNEVHFKYFDVFAQTALMASKEMVVDEKFEVIAKCIHYGYQESYTPDTMFGEDNAITDKWNNVESTKLTDRVSNRAQAYHIPVKLKALGLKIANSAKSPANLLLHNRKFLLEGTFAKDLKKLGFDDVTLKKRTEGYDWKKAQEFDYFPKEYKLLIEKLARSEHNRWNAHHYLKGWKHDENETKKPLKKHRCLIPMKDMDNRDRYTVIYDIYSVLYLPNLLTKAGFEIVKEQSIDA